jgi:hypothetical protein
MLGFCGSQEGCCEFVVLVTVARALCVRRASAAAFFPLSLCPDLRVQSQKILGHGRVMRCDPEPPPGSTRTARALQSGAAPAQYREAECVIDANTTPTNRSEVPASNVPHLHGLGPRGHTSQAVCLLQPPRLKNYGPRGARGYVSTYYSSHLSPKGFST